MHLFLVPLMDANKAALEWGESASENLRMSFASPVWDRRACSNSRLCAAIARLPASVRERAVICWQKSASRFAATWCANDGETPVKSCARPFFTPKITAVVKLIWLNAAEVLPAPED